MLYPDQSAKDMTRASTMNAEAMDDHEELNMPKSARGCERDHGGNPACGGSCPEEEDVSLKLISNQLRAVTYFS